MRNCYTPILVAALALLSFPLLADKQSYIERFVLIAQQESARSGIPVSIILAQGGHESGWGNGRLATQARNHFGIKCKKEWTGATFYHEDDDFDSNGKLLESCFRAYDSDEQSYLDHTDFLMYRSYYKECFNYSQTDYKSWAHALKRAGYATDPQYAEKLIRIIESNELYLYDQPATPQLPAYTSAQPLLSPYANAPVTVQQTITLTTDVPVRTATTDQSGHVTGQAIPATSDAPYASRTNTILRAQRRTYRSTASGVRLMATQRRSNVRRR